MRETYQVLTVTALNYRKWQKNPRVIIVFALTAILCYLLTDKLVQFAQSNDMPMQIFEPFIWTFGDHKSVFLCSIPLVLLFADIPFLGSALPFYLYRINRTKWIIGQYVYIISGTTLYMLFVLITTTALCARSGYGGNKWSSTAAMLAYSGAGKSLSVPVMAKIMEMSSPYQSTVRVFILMLLYMLLLMSLMMMVTIRISPQYGLTATIVFHIFGYIASPEFFTTLLKLNENQIYIANLVAAWLSPLQHATYYMHNFGFDKLPQLWHSYLIFGTGTLIIGLLLHQGAKKYSFHFFQEET